MNAIATIKSTATTLGSNAPSNPRLERWKATLIGLFARSEAAEPPLTRRQRQQNSDEAITHWGNRVLDRF